MRRTCDSRRRHRSVVPVVLDQHVVVPCAEEPGLVADGRVALAGGSRVERHDPESGVVRPRLVLLQRIGPDGSVLVARRVALERLETESGVVGPILVRRQSGDTAGSVVDAVGVAHQRVDAHGSVAIAALVRPERVVADARVAETVFVHLERVGTHRGIAGTAGVRSKALVAHGSIRGAIGPVRAWAHRTAPSLAKSVPADGGVLVVVVDRREGVATQRGVAKRDAVDVVTVVPEEQLAALEEGARLAQVHLVGHAQRGRAAVGSRGWAGDSSTDRLASSAYRCVGQSGRLESRPGGERRRSHTLASGNVGVLAVEVAPERVGRAIDFLGRGSRVDLEQERRRPFGRSPGSRGSDTPTVPLASLQALARRRRPAARVAGDLRPHDQLGLCALLRVEAEHRDLVASRIRHTRPLEGRTTSFHGREPILPPRRDRARLSLRRRGER